MVSLSLSLFLSVSLPFSQCWMILESVLLSILCCTVTYFTSFAVDCMPLTAICGNGTMNATGNGTMNAAPPEFSNGIAGTSKVGEKTKRIQRDKDRDRERWNTKPVLCIVLRRLLASTNAIHGYLLFSSSFHLPLKIPANCAAKGGIRTGATPSFLRYFPGEFCEGTARSGQGYIRFNCNATEYNPLATLLFSGAEPSLAQMFNSNREFLPIGVVSLYGVIQVRAVRCVMCPATRGMGVYVNACV